MIGAAAAAVPMTFNADRRLTPDSFVLPTCAPRILKPAADNEKRKSKKLGKAEASDT
jgi:hypothetical protein